MSPSSTSTSQDSIQSSTHENEAPESSRDKEDSADHKSNSGHTPSSSRNSSRSSRSGHRAHHDNDEHRSRKSSRSREKRHSHRSSRHRHDPKETSRPRSSTDEDVRDEDKALKSPKSTRSREERHSHSRHSSRHHHDGKETHEEEETEFQRNNTDDTIRDEHRSLRSSKSTRSGGKRRSHHSSRYHHDKKEQETHTETSSLRNITDDDIRRITQTHMRRSECRPELLKDFAQNGVPEDYQMEGLQKFRVISGAEARSIYNEVLRADEERTSGSKSQETPEKRSHSRAKHHRHPVVFAFPAHVPTAGPFRAGGRKVVDYYMTWKGKTGTHRLKGTSRKNDFLEPEFLKIAQGLEQHQKKRLSKLITTESTLTEEKISTQNSSSLPTLAVSGTEKSKEQNSPLRRPPALAALRDSNLSVLSLPTLGVPLKITNPDPSSPSATERTSFDEQAIHEKKTRRKHHDASDKGPRSPTLNPVNEAEEDRSKSRKHKHRRSRRGTASSSESLSSTSTSSKSSSSSGNSKEILIVLMDSDHEQDGDGDVNDETSKSTRLPSKRSSSRRSPWNGPVATSRGDIHQYVPSTELGMLPEDNVHDSHLAETPVIPMKTALCALGLHHSHSHHSSPDQLHVSSLQRSYSQQTPSTPYSSMPIPSPVSYTRSSTLPTPISASSTLPYHLSATSPYGTPFALSTPNLHSSLPPGVASSGASYVMPWASSSTPVLPPPGSLPMPELPSSVYGNSSFAPPVVHYSAAGTPFIPPTALSVASPFVGASGASGRTVVPLPSMSFYAGTPASRSEAQLVSY